MTSELCIPKTSSLKSSPRTPPPAAFAQDGIKNYFRHRSESPTSPALSSASTAEGEASPELPPLPVPRLPLRVQGILRTPPTISVNEDEVDGTRWGSPYPPNLRAENSSSDDDDDDDDDASESEGDPIHSLALQTRFLRPAPPTQQDSPSESRSSLLTGAASVLANRARRLVHGITEDWIRQHTAHGSEREKLHWLSDGSGDSENSSLSDSFPASRSNMASPIEMTAQPDVTTASDRASSLSPFPERTSSIRSSISQPVSATKPEDASSINSLKGEPAAPSTPSKPTSKRTSILAASPRMKKKVPWKGKSVMILIPKDDERGQPGKAPLPLTKSEVEERMSSWKQQGHDISGFDLEPRKTSIDESTSQSRGPWPDFDDLVQERQEKSWKVLLPDLNAWKRYVDELTEAKLRALGVSLGDDEPPQPSVSPSTSMSRQPSVANYPPLPFSPPLPTSSAASGGSLPGFPFHGMGPSPTSPGLPAGMSPASFTSKYNPRASISIPSPHAWSQQMMMQQHGHRMGSPSLANLNAMMSPSSPFSPDGGLFSPMGHMGHMAHQRHQSLQLPMFQHQPQQQFQHQLQPQFAPPQRTSSRLQDLHEIAEEEPAQDPVRAPEVGLPHHIPGDDLQREIDEAEYHLEEQMRSQLENDQDYSPHREEHTIPLVNPHARDSSVQFAPQQPQLGATSDGLVLHHPRPHSRGHSLSQKYFTEEDVSNSGGGFRPTLQPIDGPAAEDDEIETNPSNLGTPIQALEFQKMMHQHTLSNASSSWSAGKPAVGPVPKHASHGSKSSLSKLNVEAPEFKFNPNSSFTSQFTPQVATFSAATSHFAASAPTTGAINPTASVFSPTQSEFGLKFRPDAPAFTPTTTFATPAADPVAESDAKPESSVVGADELGKAEIVLPVKESKAVPILPPDEDAQEEGNKDELEGQLDGVVFSKLDHHNVELDSVAPAASETADSSTPVAESRPDKDGDEDLPIEEKSFDESTHGHPDMTLSSTMASETTDTQATVSPSEQTADPMSLNWTLSELKDPNPFSDDSATHGHKRSLSAAASEFVPGMSTQPTEVTDLAAGSSQQPPQQTPVVVEVAEVEHIEKVAAEPEVVTVPSKPTKGLAASRWAPKPPPPRREGSKKEESTATGASEPSFDDIDAVMRHLSANPNMGISKPADSQTQWHQPSPTRPIPLEAVTNSPPYHQDEDNSRSPSPNPREYLQPSQPPPTTELEDPFLDPPTSAQFIEGPVHNLNGSEDVPVSDWNGDFTEDEQEKLESRVTFFNGHVNDVVGGILDSRLSPLEQTLDTIKHSLAAISRRAVSNRRDVRSASAEVRDSDADDEDDDLPTTRRSISPRRDRKMEQIKAAVMEALASQQRTRPTSSSAKSTLGDRPDVLQALEELKAQITQPKASSIGSEDIKKIVEEVVDNRLEPTVDEAKQAKVTGLQARVLELEERLRSQEAKVETEIAARRAAEDRASDLTRELQSAATKIEVEEMNKSVLHQRIADLEERSQQLEGQADKEQKGRRAAEDKLAEVERLLKLTTEEEKRLKKEVDEKDHKIKAIEAANNKVAMRLTQLEAGTENTQKSRSEAQNRINMLDNELQHARKEARHWRSEADRVSELAKRRDADLSKALDENKALHKLIDTLGTQVQENERVRDSWRTKFLALQDEMAHAVRQITEENARRTKREQTLIARQEVLDAKLQAEARTRERIETELERLEMNERQGMRAVAECKRLEQLLADMRTENHKLQQSALRFKAEFQEARETAAREITRTRNAMQAEVEQANHQVNAVRRELEDELNRLRSQMDQVKLDADTAKAQHDMLLEEAQNSKKTELDELMRKHQNEVDDIQARYERQLNNTTEDAQRTEKNLLDRLSIETSKAQHLQDKLLHVEEKLEIAKEAARAAAQAAKTSVAGTSETYTASKSASNDVQPSERISPQALRESIMVLQEQLQAREHRIEELEQQLEKVDPDADIKISKRDDEITWLRELLAVRHSDLQDIIGALSSDDYDQDAVRDAAIRLKANLQMEEQERERAMNGGSAINLPNIAATIRDAASPRVAQAVGPLAAAWGNWRKGKDLPAFGSLSSVLSASPAQSRNVTPSKPASSGFRGGNPTPPTSSGSNAGLRKASNASVSTIRGTASQAQQQQQAQPTAFSATGRRFTPQELSKRALRQNQHYQQRSRGPSTASMHFPQQQQVTEEESSEMGFEEASLSPSPDPSTLSFATQTAQQHQHRRNISSPMMAPPPMSRSGGMYDSDASPVEDFDDDGFFEDD
ncbi:unnamed protein product [Sordaria macrospora k-hell]|uniref:WGS project CABT00000000 data, contig 2.8 n=2 Tax=Sordaria macrospora TaxID=5147 RepID=F7VUX9_SORMK|nr:uncharacterized protein SMAC_05260 [Sordaria macrospora k-hell]CCC09325.1 unnamed protein product [Sordaria macrospora k-hell]